MGNVNARNRKGGTALQSIYICYLYSVFNCLIIYFNGSDERVGGREKRKLKKKMKIVDWVHLGPCFVIEL